MRDTLILSHHSKDNAALANTTLANKHEYATRHGYDLAVVAEHWSTAKWFCLDHLPPYLAMYSRILTIGSDVLFMNMSKSIDDTLGPDSRVTLAREGEVDKCLHGYVFNNDVMLWPNNFHSSWLIRQIGRWQHAFLKHDLICQALMKSLMQEAREEWDLHVRLVDACVMNAHPPEVPADPFAECAYWKPGDWILHALGGGLATKIDQVSRYLPLVLH